MQKKCGAPPCQEESSSDLNDRIFCKTLELDGYAPVVYNTPAMVVFDDEYLHQK